MQCIVDESTCSSYLYVISFRSIPQDKRGPLTPWMTNVWGQTPQRYLYRYQIRDETWLSLWSLWISATVSLWCWRNTYFHNWYSMCDHINKHQYLPLTSATNCISLMAMKRKLSPLFGYLWSPAEWSCGPLGLWPLAPMVTDVVLADSAAIKHGQCQPDTRFWKQMCAMQTPLQASQNLRRMHS